jgi:WhiB family redox-sensing transcriptional regulator
MSATSIPHLAAPAHPPGRGRLPCHDEDPEIFFAEQPAVLDRAKQVCVSCPVRTLCLENALERREPWGVWGGELFERGRVITSKRARGRPRKSEVA